MKFKFVAVAVALTLSLAGLGALASWQPITHQNTNVMITGNFDYKKAWEEVAKLEGDKLQRKALDKVHQIRDAALKEQNYRQAIKAFIYAIDMSSKINENNEWKKDLEMLRDISVDAPEVPKALINIYLSQYYSKYLSARRFKIRGRTELEDDNNPDIETWSIAKLTKESLKYQNMALEAKDALLAEKLSDWTDYIKYVIYTDIESSTLYDAVVWYVLGNLDGEKDAEFDYRAIELVDNSDVFLNYNAEFADSLSSDYLRFQLYKSLLDIHKKDSDIYNFVYCDLRRLRYYSEVCVNPDASKIYIASLEQLLERCGQSDSAKCHVLANIARAYSNSGNKQKAYEIAQKTAAEYPNMRYANVCKAICNNLALKKLSLKIEAYVPSDRSFPMMLEYCNVSHLYFHIFKSKKDQELDRNYDKIDYIKKNFKEVAAFDVATINKGDFADRNSEILVDPLPYGRYVVVASNDKDFVYEKSDVIAYTDFRVTDIMPITQKLIDGKYVLELAHRVSGRPLSGVKVSASKDNKVFATVVSDADGRCILSSKDNWWGVDLTLKNGDDVVEFYDSFYNSNDNVQSSRSIKVFTDRAIYRPGQTIYFKVLAIDSDGKEASVASNCSVNVELRDPNRRKVENLKINTNEYGSAFGSFKIPEGLANGEFEIVANGTYKSIRVEEYKRPTFEVKFDNVEGEVKLGSQIAIAGNASTYSGVAVTRAKVSYTVDRIPEWRGWWSWYFNSDPVRVAHGTAVTDDDGKFSLNFEAKPAPGVAESEFLSYSYKVTANVTDINGETRSASSVVAAGYRTLFLNIGLSNGFKYANDAKLDSVKIYSESINGDDIPAVVTVKVSKLQNFQSTRLSKRWKSCTDPLPVLTREIWDRSLPEIEFAASDNDINLLKPEKLLRTFTVNTGTTSTADFSFMLSEGSGHYLVELESVDSEGRPVRYETRFTLYNPGSDIKAVCKPFYAKASKSSYQPGEVAEIDFGSALKDVVVHYQVKYGDSILSQGTKELNESSSKLTIPITERVRGGIYVFFYYIKSNSYNSETVYVDVPFSNKYLNVKFETFRDRLLPGENEKWRIKITDKNGKPVDAEFLATLYDESLDALISHSWWFSVYGAKGASRYWSCHLSELTNSLTLMGDSNREKGDAILYNNPRIMWFNHEPYFPDHAEVVYKSRAFSLMKSNAVVESAMMLEDRVAEMDEETADMDDNGTNNPEESQDFSNVKIRTNFNETAFFQPQIVTDKDGILYVEFTIPESLTRWKMLGFAHTKDMKMGFAQNHLVTQKNFMVQPNLPRFVRCGDEIGIPVKITNLQDTDLKGQIKFEILDAETLEPLNNFAVENSLQNFDVPKGKTIAKTFDVKVPEYVKPVAVRVSAVSGEQSDGEQRILPVLTDKTLVTDALTLSVRGNQTKNFEFLSWKNSKSTTAVNHSFTLEYSSNPAWYAVSSLPWLSENPYDCYEQTFSKIFANSISMLIINNNPEIENVLAKWSQSDSQVLTSPLLKNEELKTMLIAETPWALDGDTETDRMHKLCELLNRQRVATENDKFFKKLLKGQLSNGAWPWFDGMRANEYITQHIVSGFGKLKHMGVDIYATDGVKKMIEKAIDYLDKEVVEYYNLYIKKDKSAPGYFCLQYMYMRTFFPEFKMGKNAQNVYDYCMKYCKDNWKEFGLHYRALLAIVFKRSGNTQYSDKIIASMQDNAIRSEEFGMYFKENINGIRWHEQNIETQALIVEAFQEHNLADEVEELKIWLIKNRQANRWSTTKATTEACYAMFLCGSKLKVDEPLCTITVGNIKADNKNAEVGTGYFKQVWTKDEMDVSMANITVENPNPHISYGAVYRQYFETLDNVVASDNKLQIEKKMYLRSNDNKGKDILKEIKDGNSIKPGDVLTVRFIIKTDRDLDYVHLKDMRAAGFEPINVLSSTKYQDGMYYYESTKDASENFFIEHLNKGTYVFEYPLVAVHTGDFSNGIATIQCMYAPEFTAHSAGMRFRIAND